VMGLKQKIVDRSKLALLRPSVLRWVTDDRVMKATEGLLDARTRMRAAWNVLLNGHELPNIDRDVAHLSSPCASYPAFV